MGDVQVPPPNGHEPIADLVPVIRRVVAARIRNPAQIDDIVQETLSRVIAARARVERDTLAPYAVATARNLIASGFQREQRARQIAHLLAESDDTAPEVAAVVGSPDPRTIGELTAALLTACASSGSQPGTQAAPTHLAGTQASTTTASKPKEFVSTRYGFAVTLPQDWSEVDASFAWDGKGLQSPGSPFFANFTAPTSNRTLMGASATVPKRMRLAEFSVNQVLVEDLRPVPAVCVIGRP